MASLTHYLKTHQETTTCSCSVCTGLERLERARFFAGQFLTEAELNSAQAYVLAKNRLHNRYLHGWGVVCGLQVVCHDECSGWVTVKPGYAIDPCGRDIIVCEEHDFNVIEAIKKCREARQRRRRTDCEPLRIAVDESCKEVEEHWCLTLEYQEQEARPITALRRERAASCCHSSEEQKAACSSSSVRVQSGVGRTIAPCEPTRILEGYQLGVVEAPQDRCQSLRTALQDTLLARVLGCLTPLAGFIGKRISKDSRQLLLVAPFIALAKPPQVNLQTLHTACCQLRQLVYDLYTQNPFNVRCALLEVMNQISCPPPTAEDPAQLWRSIQDLITLLVQYILDCICQALLPPCPPDPKDDRVILACLDIRDDKIVRICNFSRRHAGAFPSLSYWLSLVPIIPLIRCAVQWLCCLPELVRVQSPLVNDLANLLDRIDPTGNLREAISAEDFALPKMYAAKFREAVDKVSPAGLAELIRPEGVNLATLVDKSPDKARDTLDKAGVTTIERAVESADEVPVSKKLTAVPFASAGDRLVVYKTADKVVGFGRYDAPAELEEIKAELADLRSEVEALRGPNQTRSGRREKSSSRPE